MIDVAEEMFNIPVRKKSWYQTVRRLYAQHSGIYTVSELCGLFGEANRLITSTIRTRICVAWPWKSWLFVI